MRPEKQAIADDLKERLNGADFFILADYTGMTVTQSEALRGKLGECESRLLVLRNRQFSHVARELGLEGLESRLTGPTAMVYGSGDVVETSKTLKAFAKENALPAIKLGGVEGKALSAEDVNQLADLPSKEQLQAMLVCTLAEPMTRVVRVMQQKQSSLVYVLEAYRAKQEDAG